RFRPLPAQRKLARILRHDHITASRTPRRAFSSAAGDLFCRHCIVAKKARELNLTRAIAIARGSFGRKRARAWRAQLGKQAPCRHEAACLESLGKLLIDGRKHIVRLLVPPASLP
ncbi:hypothetical protein ABIB06_007379, partial [Bradyrhizobium sp. LB8.2]